MIKKLLTSIMTTVVLTIGMAVPSFAAVTNSPSGSVSGTYQINARSKHTFRTISFRGGESASVYIEGDGDTDLDLYVYDLRGRLVAMDNDPSDVCLAEWVPQRTGVYIIKVVNHGNVYNEYFLQAS
jgi:hypothetical protein